MTRRVLGGFTRRPFHGKPKAPRNKLKKLDIY
jgi:hypothetical protein